MQFGPDNPSPTPFTLYYIFPLLIMVGIVFATLQLRSNPKREIIKRLESMAEQASQPPAKGVVGMARSAQGLLNFFTPDASIHAGSPFPRFGSRREFVNSYVGMRSQVQELDIQIQDPQITLRENRREAVATLTAIATGKYFGDRFKEIREFEIELQKHEGNWQMHKITLLESITAPIY